MVLQEQAEHQVLLDQTVLLVLLDQMVLLEQAEHQVQLVAQELLVHVEHPVLLELAVLPELQEQADYLLLLQQTL